MTEKSNASRLSPSSDYFASTPLQVYTERHLEQIPQLKRLSQERLLEMRAVAKVLPFRVNQYVIEELIDWSAVPSDPVFQLTFPQPGMLETEDLWRMVDLVRKGADTATVEAAANEIRQRFNPHPAGQQELNVPLLRGERLPGLQHKYRETVLFFPAHGQTCHSYCSFCFRWPQFVGDRELRFANRDGQMLADYLAEHREVTDLLITGGDPMVMRTRHLLGYLDALLHPRLEHVGSIRIGTKALSFWPQRFVSDVDADELLRGLERLVKAGKHVAVMAHINHWRELETAVCREAVRRIRDTGAVIRAQAPLVRHINDDPEVWARLWRTEAQMGIVPYYMFVERDTGARHYFEVPLARAWTIYRDAIKQVSGLARTARGPSMSSAPGKVEIQGVSRIGGEEVFVLRFIQARNPDWVQRPFFARFDAKATWLDDLRPAFGEEEFFFEPEFRALCRGVA
ncbi:MAG: KamA family radical SAM protein [Gammaproteobacteria bacterium]